jgi:hypothetical protein
VGNGRVDGIAVWALAVARAVRLGPGVVAWACDGLPEAEAFALALTLVLVALGEVAVEVVLGDVALCDVALDPADGTLVEARWPVGDGVRVPWLAVEDDPLSFGVGVKIVGTAEPPPPMHPESVTARSAAPAAARPANSHPLCAVSGLIKRIFTNPPPL